MLGTDKNGRHLTKQDILIDLILEVTVKGESYSSAQIKERMMDWKDGMRYRMVPNTSSVASLIIKSKQFDRIGNEYRRK